MLLHGVTTVEAKSGYGLDWETEKRQLDVVGALDRDHEIDLVSTFMAAHAVPPEYKGRSQEYLELIVELTSRATYFLRLRKWASSFASMLMRSNRSVE